jgi:BirA family transcriptional regulator, biotin operon repressor / biotin---[acetyl-CoA-carboxylase] ligase
VTDSTNRTAAELAMHGAPEWTLVGAGHQTAGRGRLGRTWFDRPGDALMVSIVLRPPLDPAGAAILTLLAGAAWTEAAADISGLDVRCKWPNDILAGDAKVGGVLSEAVVDPSGGVGSIVIGSGINLTAPAEVVGAAGLGSDIDPTELLAAFLVGFKAGYVPGERGFAPRILKRWRAVSDTLGRRVRAVRADGDPLEGVARDVDARGALVIETAHGVETISSGELTHLA